ncbi:MAG: FG-GAP-like repeat-containing protein, partial [Candidatus Krumholzibacteria bacterium]|nr:FG-GAP-like repeat-containing protein [Candidatus Krumholzibacteria bacterium]
MSRKNTHSHGFTLVEIMFSMVMLGIVLISFMGIFALFQKSSGQTRQFADTQQNARVAIDYITEHLRQAGSATDYVRGQRFIVHAAPYQVAFNADIDNGQTIGGDAPLSTINRAFSPFTVPASGTTIYTPPRDFQSEAETVVFTLDSNSDGVINSTDQGDDMEEGGANPNVYILRRAVYGFDGANSNLARSTNLALLRGPGASPNGSHPQPLFQYFYDHDDDETTPAKLWGDDSPEDGKLSGAEIPALTPMPANQLPSIRKVRVTVVGESDKYNHKFKDNGGFVTVEMKSEVYLRNAGRTGSTIFGMVYNDADGNGALDAGETGLPNVELRLVGLNRTVFTNGAGVYFFPISAGDFSVREFDPPGYTSTTANIVPITVASGEAVRVDFGDESGTPVGFIRGKVFEDLDMDGLLTGGEPGIQDVLISLDSGEQITTDVNGDYMFTVPIGSYNIVETDPTGFGSTTPNAATANVAAAGDTAVVNFGDTQNPNYGRIEGYVFLDDDQDGLRDPAEDGIANVTLTLSTGDSTLTNTQGFYEFSIPPAVYDITERDSEGYTSTTVNTYTGIVIAPDTVVTIDFGDILLQQDDFIEVVIANTARALSVDAADLEEDNKNDVDIVIGTPFSSGSGNMLVFLNDRKNNTTALSALFNNAPDYQRNSGNNINTLSVYDFSGDGRPDVLAGLQFNTGNNIQLWYNGGGGVLGAAPSVGYAASASNYVLESELADLNNDGHIDIIVGLATGLGTYSGGFEIFQGSGGGSFSSSAYVYTAGQTGALRLGEVWALDTGDVDGDGDSDLVVGTRVNAYAGYVDVYLNSGNASGNMTWDARYAMSGAVNAVRIVDMAEDNLGDQDLLVGLSSTANAGALFLWFNDNGVFGADDN